jgi:hypothetical protein
MSRFNAPEGEVGMVGSDRQGANPRLQYGTLDGRPVLIPPGMPMAPGMNLRQALGEWEAERRAKQMANRPGGDEMAARRMEYADRTQGRQDMLDRSRAVYNYQRLQRENKPIPGRILEIVGDFRREQQRKDQLAKPQSTSLSMGDKQQSALMAAMLGADPATVTAIMQDPTLRSALNSRLGVSGSSAETPTDKALKNFIESDPDFKEKGVSNVNDISERNRAMAQEAFRMLMAGGNVETIRESLRKNDSDNPTGAIGALDEFERLEQERVSGAKAAAARGADTRNWENNYYRSQNPELINPMF